MERSMENADGRMAMCCTGDRVLSNNRVTLEVSVKRCNSEM